MSVLLQLFEVRFEVRCFDSDFLLLQTAPHPKVAAIGTAIYQQQFDFVEEVIVTETEICLKLNHRFHYAKIGLLKRIKLGANAQQNHFKLPVFFHEHPDWSAVTTYTGKTKAQIIQQLTTCTFRVAMFGFLPGFTYFSGLPTALQVPRKTVPATAVPKNTIAIGGQYLGLYAISSPGGWYAIGEAAISILQLPNIPPVAWQLGDRLQLEAIDVATFEELKEHPVTLQTYNASN